jgi:cytoskeleton protein RodZ
MSEGERQDYGSWLREQRQRRGLSLRQVSAAIRIVEPYLQALEAGNIAILPEPYIRAFLKTYATYLGLDPEEATQRLETFLAVQQEQLEGVRSAIRDKEQRRPAAAAPSRPAQPGTPSVPTSRPAQPVTPAALPTRPVPPVASTVPVSKSSPRSGALTAGAVLIVCAVVIYAAVRLTSSPEPAGTGTPPAAEVAESTAAPGDTLIAEPVVSEPVPAPLPTTPARPAAGRRLLEAEALEETWILAVADGDTVVSRVVPLGGTVRVPFRDTLVVRMGKTDGMILRLDGRTIDDLGPPGMVLSRLVLTRDGVVTRRVTFPPDQPPPG